MLWHCICRKTNLPAWWDNRRIHSYWKGKVVLLTGGGTGIGKSMAIQLATAGAKVIITGRRSATLNETVEAAKKAVSGVGGGGGEGGEKGVVTHFVCDHGNLSSVNEVMDHVFEQYGKLDALILNHAWGQVKLASRFGGDELDNATQAVMDANYRGPIKLVWAAMAALRVSKGQVLYVHSLSAFHSVPKLGLYSSSKAGFKSWLDIVRLENRGSGVAFTVACPGLVKTNEAASYIDNDALAQGMEIEKAARLILKDGARRAREVHYPMVDRPTVPGSIVSTLSFLCPGAFDRLFLLSMSLGTGISDATPPHPSMLHDKPPPTAEEMKAARAAGKDPYEKLRLAPPTPRAPTGGNGEDVPPKKSGIWPWSS